MKAIDAAEYLVYLMSDSCDDLTNMKLNKLLYYAQGHFLAKFGTPLFEDRIEAWQHGPVIHSVYNKYNAFKDSPISSHEFNKAIGAKEKEVLFNTAREYGKYTAATLRNMTHNPNAPWAQVYTPDEYHIEIPQELMRSYFEVYETPLLPLDKTIRDDEYIGYRDNEGFLVLPKEWDDEKTI